MERYKKARREEPTSACPFPDLPADTPQMTVKDGSKIRNLLRFALSRMEPPGPPRPEQPPGVAAETPEEGPPCRQIVFAATGKGVAKAITCAEIVKRRLGGVLHQHTRLAYSVAPEGRGPPEQPATCRNVPSLWILLSRDPLDPRLPGYQAPGSYDALWAQASMDTPRGPGGQGEGAKRGGGAGGGGRGRGGRGRGGGGRGRGGGGKQMGRSREKGGPS